MTLLAEIISPQPGGAFQIEQTVESCVRQVQQKVMVGAGIPLFDRDDHPFVPT